MTNITRTYIPNNHLKRLDPVLTDILRDSTKYLSLESITGVVDVLSQVVKSGGGHEDLIYKLKALNAVSLEASLATELYLAIREYRKRSSMVPVLGSMRLYIMDMWED